MTGPFRDGVRRRVRALLDLGRARAAHDEAVRQLAQDPNDPELLELVGLCQIKLGEAREAVSTLRNACAEDPERAHLHYLLGFALREAGEGEASIARLREAVRLSPDEPVYLRALAELLADRKAHDESL